MVAVQGEPADGVVEVRERGDGKDVARDLLGPSLDRRGPARRLLAAPRKEPEVLGLGDRAQHGVEAMVAVHLVSQRGLVEAQGALGQDWNQRIARLHFHVALADLLGVVEGVRVQKGPDQLTGDIAQRELEV